jgi:hypothetical protein
MSGRKQAILPGTEPITAAQPLEAQSVTRTARDAWPKVSLAGAREAT